MCKNEKNITFPHDAMLAFENKRPVYVLIFDSAKNSWELRRYINKSKRRYRNISIIQEINGLDALLKDKTDKTVDSSKAKKEITSYENSPYLILLVDNLDLSARCMNCLHGENIYSINDLIKRSKANLLKIPNFGEKSLNEIIMNLERHGLSLKDSF